MMSKARFLLPFIEVFLLMILLNYQALFSFFSQDDFFHLYQVLGKRLIDLPYFLSPFGQVDRTFYRPLSRELYNYFAYNLFQLSPLPYHLMVSFVIFINGLLSFKLIKKVSNYTSAFLFLLFYSLSSIHNVELYYLSSIQTLIATFFMLLSIITFLKYQEGYEKFRLVPLIFFGLALISHESSMILPLIVAVFYFKVKNFKIKNIVLTFAPFLIMVMVRLSLSPLLSQASQQMVYMPVFSLKSILNSFSWYSLWSFGVSEMLPDFIGPHFNINPFFLNFYRIYALQLVTALFVLLGVIAYLLINHKGIFKEGIFIIFAGSFVISLLPFLFFPQHKFIYYLTFPIIWFTGAISILTSEFMFDKSKRLYVYLLILAYFFISTQTILLNKYTYWAAKRAAAAQVLIKNINDKYPIVQKNAVFYFKNDPNYPFISDQWGSSSKQAQYILSGSDALKLLYKSPNIEAYYQDGGARLTGPRNYDLKVITATFPY